MFSKGGNDVALRFFVSGVKRGIGSARASGLPWLLTLGVAASVAGTGVSAQVFGPPGVLSDTVPNSDTEDDDEPQVTTDGSGNWVAVWYTDTSRGGMSIADTNIMVSRSTDDGATWSAPSMLNSNGFSESGYDLDPR
jgi:hypothetical protein